jgi:S-adenosylmethionine hydrolase
LPFAFSRLPFALIITFLTDFGARDYFVGALKGAALAVNPRAVLVDLTHEIAAQDILEGAFTLLAAYEAFPPGTVHVAVVDPGVGSARRPLAVAAGAHLFVGPDNGLFSYVCERERDVRVFHLTNERFFRPAVSRTFHGRDIFAPVAGALAQGLALEELGPQITDYVRLPALTPNRQPDGSLRASIIHVDRFGNCVTNITRAELLAETGAWLQVGAHRIERFRRFFVEGDAGEVFAIWGSAGFLELAARCASAAALLGVERGQPVRVHLAEG